MSKANGSEGDRVRRRSEATGENKSLRARSVFCSGLIASILIFSSCSARRRAILKVQARPTPQNVVVLPVNNQSQDFTAPVLIRYFMEKEVSKKKFKLNLKFKEVDQQLRQMGISEGEQINEGNIQQIGQFLGAAGVFHATLLEFRQQPSENKTVIRAKFILTEVVSGRSLWEKEIELEKAGLVKVPVRGVVTSEWPLSMVRSIARGPAGKLPKKLVREALKTLPKRVLLQ